MRKAINLLLMSLLMLWSFFTLAAEDDTPISTRAELENIRLAPEGHYVLTADIDLGNEPWTPLVLSGSLNGNGHVIKNITLIPDETLLRTTIDGNKKQYDTVCIGFFGILEGANVTGLTLENVSASLRTDSCCFLGGLTGWMDESEITDCNVSGTFKLITGSKMAGISGITGYGNGKITGCTANVSLSIGDVAQDISTEQFLGGILACGHADINRCSVKLDAVSAVWGYCHDGGVVGMFAVLKKSGFRNYRVADCAVEANIRFFEKGKSRRAYCKAFIGEQLHEKVSVSHNSKVFVKEELKEYPAEIDN